MSDWPQLQVPSLSSATLALADVLQVSSLLAQMLVNRGIELDEARQMLAASPSLDFPMPDFVPDLQTLFFNLLATQQAIAIFGDYDADGLSGTAVLTCFLRQSGFSVTPILPTRSQGYGLNSQSIQELQSSGHALLITVDCGISNAAEIALARELGLQVIITDHHGLPAELPDANFTLHPAVLEIPALANLSGAGMAWWLTTLLHPVLTDSPSPESLLDLAVIGTLADMTPLRGLNFSLAKRGLQAARQTQRPGLLALAAHKQINLAQLTEDDLTFRLIPLLNAAGRIDSPAPALELLLATEAEPAKVLAETLFAMNTQRQELCKQVLEQALEQWAQADEAAVIALADSRWLHGVLGITCSQLVERFYKPVVLMAIEGHYAKASVRSPKGYHVLQALQACDDLLVRYGGHEMAGGFTILSSQIPAFSSRFEMACLQQTQQVEQIKQAEMELNPDLLNLELWQELRQLAPFGMGNPAPLFLSVNVPLQDIKSDRKSGQHFFARLDQGLRVKGWRMWDESLATGKRFDLLYSLERQEWRKQVNLELTLQAVRPHLSGTPQAEPPAASLKLKPTQTRPQKPASLKRTLPGFFWDGQAHWVLEFEVPNEVPQATTQWLDARDNQSDPLPGSGWLRYVPILPAGSTAQRAAVADFLGLELDQPLPQELQSQILQAFAQVCLLPLRPLLPLPEFRTGWQVLSVVQAAEPGGLDAQTLASQVKISAQVLEICLKSLCDLGLLAYDRERYRIQYKNQRYDLRDSPTFSAAQVDWKSRQQVAAHWASVSLERLTDWLQVREGSKC